MMAGKYQMDNKQIAAVLDNLAKLMEIHGENSFRAKAYATAAFRVSKLPYQLSEKSLDELTKEPGIGNSMANKIFGLLQDGRIPELEILKSKTPEGILQMLNVKGLGPKKIAILWKELGLETLGEIYYACNENRLVGLKGFGEKTQEQIKAAIGFAFNSAGWFRYASVEREAQGLLQNLGGLDPSVPRSLTGAIRRKNPVLQEIEMLVGAPMDVVKEALHKMDTLDLQETAPSESQTPLLIGELQGRSPQGIPYRIYCSPPELFTLALVQTTGTMEHLQAVLDGKALLNYSSCLSEVELYQQLGYHYMEPEQRESTTNINVYRLEEPSPAPLIRFEDLKGALHNHSTYSDGIHSLREMALYCKNQLHLEYLGICDHSKSAVYASGLSIDQVYAQWAEIDLLNAELAPFHIFKGIESDILGDGSLDYPDEVMAGFDFVVASIHSNLKMDEDRATSRLIRAIENPYTTILGHPTGRLLLARAGYPIDTKKVIDACAANGVVIEINANPLRLDLDWTWHAYAREKGVLLSINPDAHRVEGLLDMHYGVWMARKGSLQAAQCFNAFSRTEITHYFEQRKSNRSC